MLSKADPPSPDGLPGLSDLPYRAQQVLCLLVLMLPWLWPLTPGPSPNVVPLLVAWACFLLALPLLLARGRLDDALRTVLPASWLVAACVSACIGLAQWFGVAPATDFVSAAAVGEAYGNLRQRNQFASLTSLGLLALIWAPIAARRRGWLLAGVVLLAMANAASASRTGLLQWLLLAALAAVWPGGRRDRLLICGIALAAYAAASFLLPMLLLHWRGVEQANVFGRAVTELGCSSRKVLWSNVAHLIGQRPWTGWGLGELDYAHYLTLYAQPRFCDILDNAHNLPLHLAVELGLPAAAALVAGAGLAVGRATPWREIDPARQQAWAALAVIGVHSLLEYPLWYGPFQVASLLAVVLLFRPGALPPKARAVLTGVSFVSLGAMAAVFVTYDRVSEAYRPPDQRSAATRLDPVGAIPRPLLFGSQLRFAQLSITPLTLNNAAHVHSLASDMLHYSPEPMVIEKLIESAALLGRFDEAVSHAARYKAAFPIPHAQWLLRAAGRVPTAGPASQVQAPDGAPTRTPGLVQQ